MHLTIPTTFKQLMGAISTASSLYAFTSLILFPFLTGFSVTYGLPFPEGLFSETTAVVTSALTGCGLFGIGIASNFRRAEQKFVSLTVDKNLNENIDELFKKANTCSDDLVVKPMLKTTRADKKRIIKAGLSQATTVWAISSIILIPLLALPPLGATALLLSTCLALSFGLYYAHLKYKEVNREKIRLAQYKTASSQLNEAMKIHRARRIQSDLPIGDSLSLTVSMLSEYEKAQKWPKILALSKASLFGAMTGSSVATILGTLVFVALAMTPPGWVTGAITLAGALLMGINSYQVEGAKLTRERNIALARAYRSKTQSILQQVVPQESAQRNPSKRGLTSPHHKYGPMFIKLKEVVREVRKKHPERGETYQNALREALIGKASQDAPAITISF